MSSLILLVIYSGCVIVSLLYAELQLMGVMPKDAIPPKYLIP